MSDNSRAPVFNIELSKKLLDASEADEYTEVETMLQKNVDVNMKDKNGYTPLMFVLQNKRLDVATSLIEKGADVNAMATNGVTVMSLCFAYEILKKNESCNDYDYISLLKLVVQKWHYISIVEEEEAYVSKYVSIFKAAVDACNWLVLIMLFKIFNDDSAMRKSFKEAVFPSQAVASAETPPTKPLTLLWAYLEDKLGGNTNRVNQVLHVPDNKDVNLNDLDTLQNAFKSISNVCRELMPLMLENINNYTYGKRIAAFGAYTGDLSMIKYACEYSYAVSTAANYIYAFKNDGNQFVLNPLPYALKKDDWDCVQFLVKFAPLKCIELYLEAQNIEEESVRIITPQLTTVIANRLFDGFTSDVFKYLLGKMYSIYSTPDDKYSTIMETIIESIGKIEKKAQPRGNSDAVAINAYNSKYNKLATFMSITARESLTQDYEAGVLTLTTEFILKGANVNGEYNGRNALSYAVESKLGKVVNELLKYRKNLNIPSQQNLEVMGTDIELQDLEVKETQNLEVMVETDVDLQNKLLKSAIKANCPEYVYEIHDLVKGKDDISKYRFNDAYKAAFDAKKYDVAIEFAKRNIPVDRVGEHSYSHLLHHCVKNNNLTNAKIVLNAPIDDVLRVYDNLKVKFDASGNQINRLHDSGIYQVQMKTLHKYIEQSIPILKELLKKSPIDQMQKLHKDIENKLIKLKEVHDMSMQNLNGSNPASPDNHNDYENVGELLNVCKKYTNVLKKVLFKLKDSINVNIFVEGRSCMYYAIKNKSLEMVQQQQCAPINNTSESTISTSGPTNNTSGPTNAYLYLPNINRIDSNNLTAIEFAHNLHHYEIEEYLLTLTKYGFFKRGWFREDKTCWSCSGRTRCLTDETIRTWLLFFAVSIVFILSESEGWDWLGTSQIALYAFQGVSFLAVVITTIVSCCNTSTRTATASVQPQHAAINMSGDAQVVQSHFKSLDEKSKYLTLLNVIADKNYSISLELMLNELPSPKDRTSWCTLCKHTISPNNWKFGSNIFPNKRTLLYYAIYYENFAAIKALCVRGADMDNLDENGITARELARNLHQKKEEKPTGVQNAPVPYTSDASRVGVVLEIHASSEDLYHSINNSDDSAELDEILETYGGKQERDVCRFGSAEQFYLGVVVFAFSLFWIIYLKEESLYKVENSKPKSQGNIESTSLYERCYEQCSIKDCFGCATSEECSNDCYDQNCLSACLRAPSSTGSTFFTASTKAVTYLPMHADKLSRPLQDISETYHQSVHKQSIALQESQPDMDHVLSLVRPLKRTSHKLRGFIYFKLEGQSNEYVKMSDYPVEVVSLAEKLYEAEKRAETSLI